VASWTRCGRNTILTEPRPVEVWHDGRWYVGDLTALRREPTCWWGMVRFVVAVGAMHWHWKHQDELRRALMRSPGFAPGQGDA
jgi:hypothetical protein